MSTKTTTENTAADQPPIVGRYTAELAGQIETRWQAWWDSDETYRQPNPGEAGFDGSRPKFYCLDMFPYPSGAGLHVGHPEGYTASDIVCRYKRMNGFNVLHPMGWDAFGLPAEQYAIATGVHPAKTTRTAIDTFRRQLKRFGFCYDWSREFATIDQDYYKWTQWVFLRMYKSWFDVDQGPQGCARPIDELVAEFASGERPVRYNQDAAEISDDTKARALHAWDELDETTRHAVVNSYRLAYISQQTVNWCPKLGTALANEEVIDGRSERGGFPVLRKPLRQWMLRITSYADRLLGDLPAMDWPQSTKTQQSEWIGRSEGAEVDFVLGSSPAGCPDTLRVYTTRPDTLFGATYMVVAPEHPLVDAVLADPPAECDARALGDYVAAARNRSDIERQENKEKTGVPTGLHAINPVNGQHIPVWCADYVLVGYGTGAIMAVPAGDERDFAFAKAFGLTIRDVVYPTPVAAMAFFAQHADTGEAAGDDWRDVLADLLTIITNENAGPERFATLLATVRQRRAGKGGQTTETPVHTEYIEAIDSLGAASFDAFRARFAEARHWDAAGQAYTGDGAAVNSANDEVSLDGLHVPEAKAKITDWLQNKGLGAAKVNFRLRDWLFSRQRYWGEPFPIVYDERGHHYAVDDSALPVALPVMEDYKPVESDEPTPLLGKATDWLRTTAADAGVSGLPPDAPVTRETNTMPGWAGSCWYELRYCDPKNDDRFVGEEAERYWMKGLLGGSALRADSCDDTADTGNRNRIKSLDQTDNSPVYAAGFVGMDPYPPGEYGLVGAMITRRRLPHVVMEGATYFVTWKLADTPCLSDAEKDIVLDAIFHFEDSRYRVYAACVMPDHVHCIVRPFSGHTLADIVSCIKRFSARRVNKFRSTCGSLWQTERFDHIIRDRAYFGEFMRYIIRNPSEAGLVQQCDDYRWTSVHPGVYLESDGCTQNEEVGSESRPTQGVDLYIGGAEHAVLHLLYARFWHKVLFDLGEVSTPEPFAKLFHQGLILSHAFQRPDKSLVPIDEVEERNEGVFIETATGESVKQIVAKMSKSLRNVVNPDDVIAEYGADTFRLYEMYMGPLEASKPWNTRDTIGLFRFCQKVWKLCVHEDSGELRLCSEPDPAVEKKLHRTIAKVGADIEKLSFNTAIAALIELVNASKALTSDQMGRFVRALAPFTPHIAEEVWDRLHGADTTGSVARAEWPTYDEAMLVDDEIEIPVQIMGKVRAKITVPAGADAAMVEAAALGDAKIKELIAGKTVRKVIVVPGRMVNIVAN